jgi:hypothetical protein
MPSRQAFAELRGELMADIASLRANIRVEMHGLESDLIKWMFLFGAGTALAGLLTR